MVHHPISGALSATLFMITLALAGVLFVTALVMRFKQVTLAQKGDVRWDSIPQRVQNVITYVLFQKRLPRNGYLYSGIMHMFIFGAFVVLSVDTINFVTDGLFNVLSTTQGAQSDHLFHLPLSDTYYQGVADTFRFLCMIGLAMAFINRTVIKPERLPLTKDAMYTIFFIFSLMAFEVAQTAFHLALPENAGELSSKGYIWFSGFFASQCAGAETASLALGYKVAWWGHLVTLLAFSNYVPWSKHSHVFAAPLNIFFMSLEPKGALSKMNLEFDEEDEEAMPEYFGARSLEDLSWKQVFDGLSCTECGRCNDNCPAHLSGKPLKPMNIIVDLKHHMEDRFKERGQEINLEEDPKLWLTSGDSSQREHVVIDPDVLWSCTTCRACMEVCPVGNEHIPDIIDMRRYMTMTEGAAGHGSDKALKNMDRKGNPWGMTKNDRLKWTDDLEIQVPLWDKKNPSDYLYWVGCAGASDLRAQKVTRSVSRLMHKAGLDFSVLGKKESCTGDSARRIGDEYLFQQMAEKNVSTLNKAGVKKIVTHCPHCMNTLKNEYTQFGGEYEVIHHTELLSQLMREGKLKAEGTGEEQKRVVYHDSCYLGRYNDIYDPQRDILDALPDVERIETERNREKGLCCGAGGGQMWMEMDLGERINYVRTDELLKTEPQVIAVACNFCMTMVDDGVKGRDRGDDVVVLDLAELLDQRTGAVTSPSEDGQAIDATASAPV
jgi:Fe-S oxidoreductase